MAEIAAHIGLQDEARTYREQAINMKNVTELHGWDGEWFLRAYDDAGDKVGSAECEEGKIFIEPQGYCVLAGIGLDNGMAQKALNSVDKYLATKHGIVLLYPAYTRYYLHLGEISSYPQGYKENGSIFCHSNPWVMIAETRLGNAERAFAYYLAINPSKREEISEVHRCEPYIYAQTIAGKEAYSHGEAKNSWLTGTASWNYVAITQWILGIRPTFAGLEISPVIPAGWQGFQARRKVRGVVYAIEVERGGQPGVWVNQQKVAGNLVPYAGETGTVVQVKVVVAA